MKKVLVLLLLAIAGVAAWYFWETRPKPDNETPRQQPLAISQHTGPFNQSINTTLNAYYALAEAFVNWDSAAVTTQAKALQTHIDSIRYDELKQDSTIYQTAASYSDMFKNDMAVLTGNANLVTKRQAYNTLSQNLYDLLRVVKYDEQKIYLQQCPMAFNDTEPGLWLSKTEEIRNPYLGLHHPKYKGGMLSCGETKETLNFTSSGQ